METGATPGGRRTRSGRRRLSPEGIIATALRILGDVGVAGLTMRSLAVELDADPSAVYRHFPSKDALLAAAVDAVIADLALPESPPEQWREVLSASAHRLRGLLRDRPGLAAVLTRAPVTAATVTVTSDVLLLLREGAGLSEEQAEQGFAMVLAYVLGTGMLDDDPPGGGAGAADGTPEHAAAVRVWSPSASASEQRFRFGLELLVDALQTAGGSRS